jgi:hypothetical protein
MRWRWVEAEWQWSEKAEQGQYQRYPSERSPYEYKLRRKEDARVVRFHFFFRKKEVELERSGKQEPEVGEEVKLWAAWRSWERWLFPKTGAKWKIDVFYIFRLEVTEGQISAIRDEERVERCEREKGAEIGWVTSFQRFVCETENFVWNSLIYCKQMKMNSG